jgi:hypothetical protein
MSGEFVTRAEFNALVIEVGELRALTDECRRTLNQCQKGIADLVSLNGQTMRQASSTKARVDRMIQGGA